MTALTRAALLKAMTKQRATLTKRRRYPLAPKYTAEWREQGLEYDTVVEVPEAVVAKLIADGVLAVADKSPTGDLIRYELAPPPCEATSLPAGRALRPDAVRAEAHAEAGCGMKRLAKLGAACLALALLAGCTAADAQDQQPAVRVLATTMGLGWSSVYVVRDPQTGVMCYVARQSSAISMQCFTPTIGLKP